MNSRLGLHEKMTAITYHHCKPDTIASCSSQRLHIDFLGDFMKYLWFVVHTIMT